MNYTTLSKAALVQEAESLSTQLAQSKLNEKAVTNFANNLIAFLSEIEKVLSAAPFLNEKGKFFKKLFWVLSNLSIVATTLETLFSLIRQWREYFDKVRQVPPQEDSRQVPSQN